MEHAPRIDDLLSHAGWLDSLARRLARDPDVAADLVQETWVSALESPPAERRSVRAWLARVLHNHASERGRSESARAGRERRAALEREVPSADEVLARAQGQRLLVDAVLGLGEPYRTTVLLRYFEGVSAAAIARGQGVPESTVRNRLRRGLAALRESLERTSRTDGRPWLAALAPLARTGEATPSAGIVTITKGLLIVGSTKALVAAAVGSAVAIGLWIGLDPAVEGGSVDREAERARIAATEPISRGPEPGVRDAVGAERAPDASPPAVVTPPGTGEDTFDAATLEPVEPGALEIVVLEGARPIGVGTIHLLRTRSHWLPRELPFGDEDYSQHPVDRSGVTRVVGLEPDWYSAGVEVVRGGPILQTGFRLKDEQGQRLVLHVGTARLRGHVYDAAGLAVEGARVQVDASTGSFSGIVWTDATGAYDVGRLHAGERWVAVDYPAAEDADRDAMLKLVLEEGETLVHDFGRPAALPTWSGVVRYADGTPSTGIGDGRLHLERISDGNYRAVRYDASGEFVVQLEPGVYTAKVSSRSHMERHPQKRLLEILEADVRRDVVLPGTRVEIQIVDRATGEPARLEHAALRGSVRPEGHDYPAAFRSAPAGEDGKITFDGLGPGTWLLSTWPDEPDAPLPIEINEDDVHLTFDLALDLRR